MDSRKRQVYIGLRGEKDQVVQCTWEAWDSWYKLLGYEYIGAAPTLDGFDKMVPGGRSDYTGRLVAAAR